MRPFRFGRICICPLYGAERRKNGGLEGFSCRQRTEGRVVHDFLVSRIRDNFLPVGYPVHQYFVVHRDDNVCCRLRCGNVGLRKCASVAVFPTPVAPLSLRARERIEDVPHFIWTHIGKTEPSEFGMEETNSCKASLRGFRSPFSSRMTRTLVACRPVGVAVDIVGDGCIQLRLMTCHRIQLSSN